MKNLKSHGYSWKMVKWSPNPENIQFIVFYFYELTYEIRRITVGHSYFNRKLAEREQRACSG